MSLHWIRFCRPLLWFHRAMRREVPSRGGSGDRQPNRSGAAEASLEVRAAGAFISGDLTANAFPAEGSVVGENIEQQSSAILISRANGRIRLIS